MPSSITCAGTSFAISSSRRSPNGGSTSRCSTAGSHHTTSWASPASTDPVQPGADRRRRCAMPPSGRSSTESRLNGGQPAADAGRPARRRRRIDGAVQRAHPPAFVRLVADRRHDQQIARARRRHVGQAHAFGQVAAVLLGLPVEQILAATSRRSAARSGRARRRSSGWPRACASLAVMSASTTTGNSSPLALCTVIRRTPSLPSSTIGASVGVAALGRLAQRLDEAAERQPVVALVLARQLGHVQHVGQHLLAAAAQREADVRARVVEQPRHRLGHRPAVALRVQARQQRQRVADRLQVRRQIRPARGTDEAPRP